MISTGVGDVLGEWIKKIYAANKGLDMTVIRKTDSDDCGR